MRTHDWPIRSKLTALVFVPVTALLALWIFATTLTFGPALELLAARTYLYDLGRPGEAVVTELQRERRLTVVQLAGAASLPALAEQRQRTDRAVQELRRRVDDEELRDAADAALEPRIDRLVNGLDALPTGRDLIDQRKMDRAGAFGLYSGVISSAFQVFTGMAALPEPDLNREALALTALGRSRELLGQADTLLAGALTAGRFGEGEYTQLVQIIGNQRLLAADAVADLPAADRTAYQRLTESQVFARLRTMQDALIAADRSAPPPVDPAAWQASYDAAQQELREFELAAADGLADRSVPTAVRVLVRLAAAGLLGLIAVVASLLVAVQVGRSLARRLSGVRTAAQELAEHRLPDVVARLRRGEHVDVAREAPPLESGNDEIGQVGRAFTEVQRTAIQSTVDEVTLRRGLNEVFLNIARRSQGLVHRQLALLDRMERGTEDPDQLAELFQVDHLATRLRRHAEDLVILAGAAPGRGWRGPVAMVDLARGAISEVEAYHRVDITTVQPAGVLGRAVGDVIHLLAELIENATAFSPPATRVVITGQRVANGYALEITDRGLGMSETAIEAANRRLTRSPEFDPIESARLGLFVVARLAARHGVKVSLRRSEPNGVIAVVLVPGDLITDEPAPLGLDLPAGGGPARPERRQARGVRGSTVPRSRPAASGRGVTGRPAAGGSAVAAANGTTEPNGLGAGRGRPDAAGVDVPAGSEVVGVIDGLPRRVRRGSPGAGAARPSVADQPTPRAPEEVRRIMAALQSGTARGRQAAEEARPAPLPTERANGAAPTDGGDAEGGALPAADDPIRPPDAPVAVEPLTETERDA